MRIKFGTSGWRAIIADEFTFANVRVVTQAIADYLREQNLHNKSVVIGHDTRFMAEDFTQTVAQVFAANGIESHVCEGDTPTPVVAFEILRTKAAGGVILTASHNPAAYMGLKFNSEWGGPSLPAITKRIESLCDSYLSGESTIKPPKEASGVKKRLIVGTDPRETYFAQLEKLIDVEALRASKMTVIADPLWSAGRRYLPAFLERCGVNVTAIHMDRDVLYGNVGPSPEGEALDPLRKAMKGKKATLGLATDGDADRFGIVDADGTLISPNEFLPLAVDHLVKTRKWKGVVARSVMTSHFLDAVAREHGLELRETPVGFKYIGEIMAHEASVYPAKGGGFVLGGEESGGISIRGHVPEKDGVLACLLAAEIVAVEKRSLRACLDDLQKRVGRFTSDRINFHVSPERMIKLKETLSGKPPTKLAGLAVKRIVDTDGHKFILNDGSWIGVRLSGTEPVVRLYLEADGPEKLKTLAKAGKDMAGAGD